MSAKTIIGCISTCQWLYLNLDWLTVQNELTLTLRIHFVSSIKINGFLVKLAEISTILASHNKWHKIAWIQIKTKHQVLLCY